MKMPIAMLAATFIAANLAAAPAVLWINAIGGENQRVDLRVNGNTLFRQVSNGTVCPWFSPPVGTCDFELRGKEGALLSGQWEFTATTKAVLVTFGHLQLASRTLVLPATSQSGCLFLNAAESTTLQLGDEAGPAARPGFSLTMPPDGTVRLVFENGGYWTFSVPASTSTSEPVADWFIALHQPKSEAANDLLATVISLKSGKTDDWVLAAGTGREAKQVSSGPFQAVFHPAPDLPPPPFDPVTVDWTKVKSKIAWFNATPSNQSLAIGGMMAFRQLRSGSIAHFAPWPPGSYTTESHTNPGSLTGKGSFTLDPEKKVVLVSVARINEAARIFAIEAAKPDTTNSKGKNTPTAKSTVRIMNALPLGQLRLPAGFPATQLESGDISTPLVLDTPPPPGFPGSLTLTTGIGKDTRMHPKAPNFAAQPGDWVLITHLNPANPDALDYAWVDIANGKLLSREDFSAVPAEN